MPDFAPDLRVSKAHWAGEEIQIIICTSPGCMSIKGNNTHRMRLKSIWALSFLSLFFWKALSPISDHWLVLWTPLQKGKPDTCDTLNRHRRYFYLFKPTTVTAAQVSVWLIAKWIVRRIISRRIWTREGSALPGGRGMEGGSRETGENDGGLFWVL